MKTFALNEYNDIYLDGTGQIAMSYGETARAIVLRSAILTAKGELQLDTERGIPYFTTIFDSRTKVKDWAQAVRKTVKSFPWAVSIESFDYEFDGDELKYDIVVKTKADADGTTRVEVASWIDSGIRIPVYVDPNGGEGDMGDKLIDSNGIFYLPIGLVSGVQRYRKMPQIVDQHGVSVVLSDEQYTRNENGEFIEVTRGETP